jgi:hypothetical protein
VSTTVAFLRGTEGSNPSPSSGESVANLTSSLRAPIEQPFEIPYEELPRSKIELPKRQHRGDYKETDYPFRMIPEVF